MWSGSRLKRSSQMFKTASKSQAKMRIVIIDLMKCWTMLCKASGSLMSNSSKLSLLTLQQLTVCVWAFDVEIRSAEWRILFDVVFRTVVKILFLLFLFVLMTYETDVWSWMNNVLRIFGLWHWQHKSFSSFCCLGKW